MQAAPAKSTRSSWYEALMFLKTHHGTIVCEENRSLCHRQHAVHPVSLADLSIRFKITYLNEGTVTFQQGGKYLGADPNKNDLYSDRMTASSWEYFSLIPTSYRDTKVRIEEASVTKRIEIVSKSFFLSDPLVSDAQDRKWHSSNLCRLQPASSGWQECGGFSICTGSNKVVTAKHGAHGVVFDETGVYNFSGFLGLRKFSSLIVENSAITHRFGSEDINFKGSYALPFDGNSSNYFHWTLDGLVTLFAMRANGIADPALLIADCMLFKWQQESLDLLGEKDLQVVNGQSVETIAVDKLSWASHHSLRDISSELICAFRKMMQEKAVGKCTSTAIYIRRGPGRRAVANEREVIDYLSKKGFHAIELESLSIKMQIALFRTAEIVVGPHGAGLSNIVYANPKTDLIEFLPDDEHPRSFFWTLANKLDVRYGFLRCSTVSKPAYISQMIVCLTKLQTTLEAFGR